MSGGLRFAPAPPNVSCVPAKRELVSVGPLPLYLSGGGQAPGHPIPLPATKGGIILLRFCGFKLLKNNVLYGFFLIPSLSADRYPYSPLFPNPYISLPVTSKGIPCNRGVVGTRVREGRSPDTAVARLNIIHGIPLGCPVSFQKKSDRPFRDGRRQTGLRVTRTRYV